MPTPNLRKCENIEDTIDMLIRQMSFILSKLDSKNVKRLDTNETSIKSANGETYINGPILEMYDSSTVLRLKQGLNTSTNEFLFELYNEAGTKTVGIDSNGDATFIGSISSSAISGGTIIIGTAPNCFKADSNGIYLGHGTFASAPFRVDMTGELHATDAFIIGTITGSSFNTLAVGDPQYIQIDDDGFHSYRDDGGVYKKHGMQIETATMGSASLWYYLNTIFFSVEYSSGGVFLYGYNNTGLTKYSILYHTAGTTSCYNTWDFSSATISGLTTDNPGNHTHDVDVGGTIYTTTGAGSHNHTVI